jgi:hypothetical protein
LAVAQDRPAARDTAPVPLTTDRVELLDQRRYEGLIEFEDGDWISLIDIRRRQGQPMHLVVRLIDRRSVASVIRVDAVRREKLRQEVAQFRNRAEIEAGQMKAVLLKPLEREGNRYQHYQGKWFSLDSTADELTTRKLVVRTEMIFAAYRQILAPRTPAPRPPRLVFFASMDQYRAFLGRQGVKIENPACFIERENLVAAGSELARVADLLAKISAQNQQVLEQLEQLRSRLPERLKALAEQMRQSGLPSKEIKLLLAKQKREFEKQIDEKVKEADRYDRENAKLLRQNAERTFARLYHESFHAYLQNYVYPSGSCAVPNWLNEGLAMVFERGVLEGGMLRIDAPNATALTTLQHDLAGSRPMPLAQLLAANQGNFLLGNQTAPAEVGRHYAYAWGLAHYLTFQKQLLVDPALDQYVQPAAKNREPVERFEQLIHQPLQQFEPQWRQYIQTLR